MRFDPAKPYNDLPLLPPTSDIETKSILKQLNLSSRALAGLKEYSDIVPNKNILVSSIVIKESKDSSEIENIVTTHDELYRSLATSLKSIDPNTKEVLNYRKALWKGFKLIKDQGFLVTNTIISIQAELEQNNAGIRKLPGTSLTNDQTGKVIYTPPVGEDVIRNLLKNLEDYINIDDDIDPLIKMAVIHYQFESIHPFYDGNGRTGRIINVLYLVLKNLLDSPILYLSGYIIKNKSEYYKLLQEVKSNNNWEKWILFILKGIEETSKMTLQLLKEIKQSMDTTLDIVKMKLSYINNSNDLVSTIYNQPYTKIKHLEDEMSISRQTASQYLKKLETEGILSSVKAGKETIYLNIALFDILKKGL
jgi:Fic family protein